MYDKSAIMRRAWEIVRGSEFRKTAKGYRMMLGWALRAAWWEAKRANRSKVAIIYEGLDWLKSKNRWTPADRDEFHRLNRELDEALKAA